MKQTRKDKGLPQKEVAEKLLMIRQQHSRFENGVFELIYHQIIMLCDLFEIALNELFDLS